MGLTKKVSDSIHGRRWSKDKVPDEEQAIGTNGPYSGQEVIASSQDTVIPTFSVACLRPEVHESSVNAIQPASTPVNNKVKITVGTEAAKQTWLIDKDLLCEFSDYFKGALRNDRFNEALTGECILPEDDPVEFKRFVEWLHRKDCCKTDVETHRVCGKEQRCLYDLPEKSFVTADRFIAQLYCRFLLSHFIQQIENTSIERLLFIAQNSIATISLCRFVRHWVAHLIFQQASTSKELLPHGKETNEKDIRSKGKPRETRHFHLEIVGNEELIKELDLDNVGWASTDPRKYQTEHWMEKCGGDIHANCKHRILRGIDIKIKPPPLTFREWIRELWKGFFFLVGVSFIANLLVVGPVTTIVLSSYVWNHDGLGVIASSTKVVSVLAGVSMFGCIAHPISTTISAALGLASAIMVTISTKGCFELATGTAQPVDICRIGAGLAAMVWLWLGSMLAFVCCSKLSS